MTEEDWLTDPKALDTICALRGFLPGDEVMVQGGRGGEYIGVYKSLTGKVFTVFEDYGNQIGTRYSGLLGTEIVAVCESGSWVLCRRNIKAWRRPKKTG